MAATSTSPHLQYNMIPTAAPMDPDRTTVLWALYIQSEIITNLFLAGSHHMTSFWVWKSWHSLKIHFP